MRNDVGRPTSRGPTPLQRALLAIFVVAALAAAVMVVLPHLGKLADGPARRVGYGRDPKLGATSGAADAFVDRVRNQLIGGTAAFFAPTPMERGRAYDVTVEIAPATESPQGLIDELKRRVGQDGASVGRFVNVSTKMIAGLNADDPSTNVTLKGQAERLVLPGEHVNWTWTVVPAKAGPLRLTATLTAVVNVDGKDSNYQLPSFNETVTVNITNQQRIDDAMAWATNHWVLLAAAGGGLVSVGGWIWKRRPATPTSPE